MTLDDVKQWAIQAGDDWDHTLPDDKQFLLRFAALVAAAEREACAALCDTYEERLEKMRNPEYQPELANRQVGAMRCAAAIRARGNT